MAGERIFCDQLDSVVNAGGTTAHALSPVAQLGGRMRVITDNFEVTTGQIEIGDIIVIARLPSHAVIHSMLMVSDALDTASALRVQLGIYETSGTVVDVDAYATADDVFIAANNLPGEEFRYGKAITDPADMGERIWENGGESADPSAMRDIAWTVSTAATTAAGGTIGYRIEYTID